jgi:hypothetical protein
MLKLPVLLLPLLALFSGLSVASAAPWRDALKPYTVRENTLCNALKIYGGVAQSYAAYRITKTPFYLVKPTIDSFFTLDGFRPIGDTSDKGQGFYTNEQGKDGKTTHIIHFDTVDRYTTDICIIELPQPK